MSTQEAPTTPTSTAEVAASEVAATVKRNKSGKNHKQKYERNHRSKTKEKSGCKSEQKPEICLAEKERLQLQQKIKDFLYSGEDEIVLKGLSNEQRKYLHSYVARFGLKSRSYGGKADRELHVKRKHKDKFKILQSLTFSKSLRSTLFSLVPAFQSQLLIQNPNCKQSTVKQRKIVREAYLQPLGPSMIPPRPQRISNELFRDKQELPIFHYQNAILDMLKHHNSLIINGETGSGKTSQVPQYILLDAERRGQPCRIIVTQPRRVAAVSIAQRVAEERGETVGATVGYQIRMENRISKTTNLIYTTSGCFLRSIMMDSMDLFRKTTHIILDEIHERDKNTDFSLITLKEQMKINKDLKVILMSATMDINLLSKYFDDCPVLNVPGQSYDVKIYHLEDILFHTGYRTLLMEKYLRSMAELQLPNLAAEDNVLNNICTVPDSLDDEDLQQILDSLLEECLELEGGSNEEVHDMFDQMRYYIESEGMSVNAGHSTTGVTPLMAACKCNMPDYVRLFLQQQANVSILDNTGHTAIDYASLHQDSMCLHIIMSSPHTMRLMQQQKVLSQVDQEKQRLLNAYQQQFNDDNDVDHDLILSLLEGLYRSAHPGAIMVFFPGYSDIVLQRDLIQSTFPAGTYKLCILHGQMDCKDQIAALQKHNMKKIILSTNIGQTSITIPDLAFIIDSGKVKMNTFDSISESSQLHSVWISQADACQRSGRAGRTQNGICYRLYSQAKYQFMSRFSIPEFMRVPLTEICLYAKVLEPKCEVQNYLARSLNPPSTLSVQNALKKLKILGVLNEDESVTDLGRHLVDIPVDVQLGILLLYGVFYKCIDPILTICAYHSIKEPFVLPADRSCQGQAASRRRSLSGDSLSDQMGVLVLYKNYMAIRHSNRNCIEFCAKYYISQNAMEMFCATRRSIEQVLRQKFKLNQSHKVYNNSWHMIQFCLVAGLYPNIVAVDRNTAKLVSGTEKQLWLQKKSALNATGKTHLKEFMDKLPYNWIVFYEKSLCYNKFAVHMNTMVHPLMVLLGCGSECEILDRACLTDRNSSPTIDEQQSSTNSLDCLIAANNSDSIQTLQQYLIDSFKNISLAQDEQRLILLLNAWISFDMLCIDAKLILLIRTAIQMQFKAFLKSEQYSNIAQHIDKVLNALPQTPPPPPPTQPTTTVNGVTNQKDTF